MKVTQRQRILDRLRVAGKGGVCSWDLAYRSAMPHASSRIPELNAEGYTIDGQTGTWPDEEHGSHAHYFLIREPSPTQLTVWTDRGQSRDKTSVNQRVIAAT